MTYMTLRRNVDIRMAMLIATLQGIKPKNCAHILLLKTVEQACIFLCIVVLLSREFLFYCSPKYSTRENTNESYVAF